MQQETIDIFPFNFFFFEILSTNLNEKEETFIKK